MHIYVKTPTDKTIALVVDPGDTIEDVKSKIFDKEGINLEVQRLFFNDRNLQNDRTLSHYNLWPGSVLELFLKNDMLISVKTPSGKTITFEIGPGETTADVKDTIFKMEGVPQDEQRLTFNDRKVPDRRTLSDCNIRPGSNLELYLRTVMQIFVYNFTNKIIALTVDPGDTIEDVKGMIFDKECVPIYKQQLMFAGKIPANDRTLSDCHIQNESTLHLIPRLVGKGPCLGCRKDWPFVIFIRISSTKEIQLPVCESDAIWNLKGMIEQKENIPLNEQQLFFNDTQLEDNHTVSDCLIQNRAKLDVVTCSKDDEVIIVNTQGEKNFYVVVIPSDTISDVKAKIQTLAEIPPDRQHLMLAGRQLENDHTLYDYNVLPGSIFHLEIHLPDEMQIVIRLPFDSTIVLYVKPSDTIKNVKTKIHDREGIPPDHQEFIFNKRVLRDDRTLSDCNIHNESTLELLLRRDTIKIFVECLSGKKIALDVKALDTVKTVKAEIQAKEGIPLTAQRLIFDDLLLDDDDLRLFYYKVQEGATLRVLRSC